MAETTTTIPASGAYEKGKLYQLELAHLQADPNQPRTFMDPLALEDLTESIRQHGLMPILFRSALRPQHLFLLGKTFWWSFVRSIITYNLPTSLERHPPWEKRRDL